MKRRRARSHRLARAWWQVPAACGILLLLAAIRCGGPWNRLWVDDTRYDSQIAVAARRHHLPVALVRALIRQESCFRADAVGSHGEIGLMQLLPSGAVKEWARVYRRPVPSRRQVAEVETNLEIGCWYLSVAMRRWREYRHGTELALAQYNAGEKNAARWKPDDPDGAVIPRITWPGTRQYVENIMKYYRKELASHRDFALQ